MSGQIYDPMAEFRQKIEDSLASILGSLGITQPIELESPPEGLGDFALPCFNLAPLLKKSPNDIAIELSNQLPALPGLRHEVKGPYLNFFINAKELIDIVLPVIFELGARYGTHPSNGLKVILEHTSANPTDKLHVGRARNPVIGDTLARVLRCAGYEVETQYYVDDMGKQSARKILASRYAGWDRTKYKTGYQWATSATTTSSEDFDAEKARELDEIMDGLERGDQEILKEGGRVCGEMMEEIIIPSLKRINVEIDKYVNESQFMLDDSVGKVIEKLKNSEYCGIEDGANYIDLSPFDVKSGKDKFFFLRADGKSLYATRDIAYHQWKFKHCDIAINILGEDHKLEAEYVRLGLNIMNIPKVPESIFYAFVNLPEGRMSTRRGKVVYLDDLIDEAQALALDEVKKRREDLTEDEMLEISEKVGSGAIRYNIIRVQAEKKIVFKWEDALNFEGDSAPFAQYAHARACSILRKAERPIDQDFYSELINDPNELNLVRTLSGLPGVVGECAEKRCSHFLASYAHDLAGAFNQFYRDCPVLQAVEPKLVTSRLTLVEATRIVLKNTLGLLGLSALERM
ncbi:arginine--tRNA ligase [[Eubacterium] cellulosolvens]